MTVARINGSSSPRAPTANRRRTTFGWSRPRFPLQARQMLLRTIYLSRTPTCGAGSAAGPSYARPVEVGEIMEGGTVCEVVTSNLSQYRQGDLVLVRSGWQESALSDGDGVRKLDPSHGPISYGLGVPGTPGFTAYTGLLNIGQPRPGETLVVAAASGAVGSVVGQVARIKGCRVVGIAGGERKCRYVEEELGFDACLDHHQPDFPISSGPPAPAGSTSTSRTSAVRCSTRSCHCYDFARVPVCGLIAHYNATGLPEGPDRVPALLREILVKRLTFRGFIVWDFASQFGEFAKDMSGWLARAA